MREAEPSLARKVEFLSDPAAYPGEQTSVERLETHMSWVFLTRDRVYKLKKPVRFEYLDFSTLPLRERMCRAEVRLNRRLAPDVYLGVAPLARTADGFAIGGEGEVVDWLIVMRRLDTSLMLDQRLRDRQVRRRDFERLSLVLAAFYVRARRQIVTPEQWARRWRLVVGVNGAALSNPRFALPEQTVRRVDRAQRLFIARNAGLLAERVCAGRIVEGHGDLRPEHIWLGDGVKVIDCLEFNADLRRVDPLQELAYLDLECRRLGGSATAPLRATVCRRLGDDAPEALFLFYRCYAATLRARLAAAHTLEPQIRLPEKWIPLAKSYLRLALADAVRLERLLTARGVRRIPLRGEDGRSRPQATAQRSARRAARPHL